MSIVYFFYSIRVDLLGLISYIIYMTQTIGATKMRAPSNIIDRLEFLLKVKRLGAVMIGDGWTKDELSMSIPALERKLAQVEDQLYSEARFELKEVR